MKEKQEIYCHECENYVQFNIDMSLNGNHVLKCPVCGHEHCRVVKNGEITEDRWDSRNDDGGTYTVSVTGYSQTSIYSTSTASSVYLTASWSTTGVTTV
jgi:hypothetical protein